MKNFLVNVAKGAAIGMAMIIPGVSGGTVAVLLGVYDAIIESFGGMRAHFKKSVIFLFPILLGAVAAFAALYYPLAKLALPYAPFPTVMLFAGLMLGSFPDLIISSRRNGFKRVDAVAIGLPLAIVVGVCFIPTLGEANLSGSMPGYGYALLVLMGALASCALVVPGISGSMLMLIFGYYRPLLDSISALKSDTGHAILVLALFALGVIVGFFTIAKLMQVLLNKFRRATFWAICGFVLGSVPAVIITFFHNAEMVDTLDGLQIALGAVLTAVGAAATFILTWLARKHQALPQAEDGAKATPPA